MSTPPAPRISVIIPAHNAEATLRESLASVFTNGGVTYEVVLVNDASTDRTEAVALEFPCRVISLKANIMSANCRNLGARHARGEMLVFFDADQLMSADTLRRYAEALDAHPDVSAVVGSLAPDTPMPGFFSRFKNFQHHYTHQTARVDGATLASGLTAIRRDVFLAAGGFEPAFAGASIEDIALGYRLVRAGHKIRFAPAVQIVHLKAYTFRSMVRSDILNRAIPWTGLMLRERFVRNDLNTRSGNVLSVAFAWMFPVALVAWLAGWWAVGLVVAIGSVLAIWGLNAAFLSAARRAFGTVFATRAAAFLPVMYFYHGVGLLAGIGSYAFRGSVAKVRSRPMPDYEVRDGPRVVVG